jgi:hypothetical protein
MRRGYAADVDALPPDEASELRELIHAANIPDLVARPTTPRPQPRPDAFHYRLVVEEGGQRHTIEVSDTDMPSSLRPLVDWLAKRASPGTP